MSLKVLPLSITNEKVVFLNVLTVLNVQMNDKNFFFNGIFCDIHVQGAHDVRSSAKNTKFFYFLPKKLPLYENHLKSPISYRGRK